MEELSQHILDIAVNSLEAGATELDISIREDTSSNILEFKVLDNGCGISEKDMQNITDPFYTTKNSKRVGLGVPLLQQAVHRCGGVFEIKPLPGGGTSVKAMFPYDHLDRAPLGDISGTLVTLIGSSSSLNLIYQHRYNDKNFLLNTTEIRTTLGDISLQNTEVLVWLKNYLQLKIQDLRRDPHEDFGRTG